jgi:hypothetical protein
MRFEIANLLGTDAPFIEVPWSDADGESFLDLREDASAIVRIGAARENPPMAAFLVALNGDASVFCTVRAKTWADTDASRAASNSASAFHSRVDLTFADSKFSSKEHQEDVVRQLVELWMKEPSAETFSARLEILPCRSVSGRWPGEAALRIVLTARGDTPQKAQMRWGIGIAKVQQALLFVSRALRMKTASKLEE